MITFAAKAVAFYCTRHSSIKLAPVFMSSLSTYIQTTHTTITSSRNPPHIHVKHGGDEFTINLGDRVIEGRAKSKHVKLINDFIDEHEAELYTLWEKAQRGEYIEKIAR